MDAALQNGHQLTLFNRGNNPVNDPEIEQILGDREGDLSELSGRRWDAVIDTSGLLPWTVQKATEVLKDSGHYTFVSSISVYKDHSNPGINE